MRDVQHYSDEARRFARLSAEALTEEEREGYFALATVCLQLAKDAAAFEAQWERAAASVD